MQPHAAPILVEKQFSTPLETQKGVAILGSAGQRIVTAGEILCYAGLTAGLQTIQKNDYPITVLRGHSVSEVIMSPGKIDHVAIEVPNVVLALDQEGIERKKSLFETLTDDTLVLSDSKLKLPACRGNIVTVDFKAKKVKRQDMAIAALALLTQYQSLISLDMLRAALRIRFKGDTLEKVLDLVRRSTT